jgi:hypothetical protein
MVRAPVAAKRGCLLRGTIADVVPLVDSSAKASYRNRLSDLREQLDEAECFNDIGRIAAVREEIGALTSQLASAVGLGGRNRGFSSDAERARVTVTKRIKDVVRKLRTRHPALARHLASEIKTGYFCSYRRNPDHPIEWFF